MPEEKKEYILERAFEVFMAKGYDSASMTILHKELNMSRGAMYRYFDSKDDLFKAVIDKYFWVILNSTKLNINENTTVEERIEDIYQHLKKIGKYMDNLDAIETKFLNFTALVIQAIKHYPGFIEELKKYKKERVKEWERVLKNSIEKGEIRPDINIKIMAQIFSKSFNAGDSSTPDKSFTNAIELSRKMMEYIYSLIKV